MTIKRHSDPTRRSVLTGVGAAGVGAYGFLRFSGAPTVDGTAPYTNYTLAETHGPKLLVGWYSTYNGELRSGSPLDGEAWEYDSTDEYVDDVDAALGDVPAVDLDNVLPGDGGTLSAGLFVDPDSESARVWLRLAGDDGRPTDSPLSEAIGIDVWYDTGIFGIGGCQGAESDPLPGNTITPAGATLADPGALVDGVELNPGIFDNGEISPGDRVCIALRWRLPADRGNELQNSSSEFDLEFRAVEASNPSNPFGVDGDAATAGGS